MQKYFKITEHMSLFVGNIPRGAEPNDFEKVFRPFGDYKLDLHVSFSIFSRVIIEENSMEKSSRGWDLSKCVFYLEMIWKCHREALPLWSSTT